MSKVRNLFRRAPAGEEHQSGVDVKVTPAEEPDYKLSSVSADGQFIPPSPPEKQSFLSRFTHRSTTTTSHSSVASRRSVSGAGSMRSRGGLAVDDEDEEHSGFTIPRASFDGYRRSFDIRPSMDEQRPVTTSHSGHVASARVPRSSFGAEVQPPIVGGKLFDATKQQQPLPPPSQVDLDKENSTADKFDDVDLNDAAGARPATEVASGTQQPTKKRFWQKATGVGPAAAGDKESGAELHPYTPTQPASQSATQTTAD